MGVPLAYHADVDMISFTGSTRAGIDIARNAAPTVKRVTQELGGKSPNIVLDDEDFAENVGKGVANMMGNSGQTCSAPHGCSSPPPVWTKPSPSPGRPRPGSPWATPWRLRDGAGGLGAQFEKIQSLIRKGIDEGATLVVSGTGRPDGLEKGYYVKPTVFARVTNDMTVAREEIFGPVVTILGYDSVDHAVEIANDTEYGLAYYVAGADLEKARAVARRIRAGWVAINDAFDFGCPFGGYKKSGNGREWGEFGFHDYLETKGILG